MKYNNTQQDHYGFTDLDIVEIVNNKELLNEWSNPTLKHIKARYKTITTNPINNALYHAFDEPSNELQYKGCIKALKAIDKQEILAGMESQFLIALRDFLLDYNK